MQGNVDEEAQREPSRNANGQANAVRGQVRTKKQGPTKSKAPPKVKQCRSPVMETSITNTGAKGKVKRHHNPPSTANPKKQIPSAQGRNPANYEGLHQNQGAMSENQIPRQDAPRETKLRKKKRCTPSAAQMEATAQAHNAFLGPANILPLNNGAHFGGYKAPSVLSPILPLPGDASMHARRRFVTTFTDDSAFPEPKSPTSAETRPDGNSEAKDDDTDIWKTQQVLFVPESPTTSQETELYSYSQKTDDMQKTGMYFTIPFVTLPRYLEPYFLIYMKCFRSPVWPLKKKNNVHCQVMRTLR